jgi:hypothetical protein
MNGFRIASLCVLLLGVFMVAVGTAQDNETITLIDALIADANATLTAAEMQKETIEGLCYFVMGTLGIFGLMTGIKLGGAA